MLDLKNIKTKADILKVGNIVLARCRRRENRGIRGAFEENPIDALDDYTKFVRRPMYYALIEKNIKQKKYATLDCVRRDLEQVFANAMSYNADESNAYVFASKMMNELKGIFLDALRENESTYSKYFGHK